MTTLKEQKFGIHIDTCLWDVLNLDGYAITVPYDSANSPWCYEWMLKKATRLEAVFFTMGYNKCRTDYEDDVEGGETQ